MSKLRSLADIPTPLLNVAHSYMAKGFTQHQAYVNTLMLEAGQAVPDKPTVPSPTTRELRAKLILEEAFETICALGVRVKHRHTAEFSNEQMWEVLDIGIEGNFQVEVDPDEKFDMAGVVDGCTDIIVVTTGTLSALGVNALPAQNQTDYANLDKFGPGSKRREDGKWLKPPGWQEPDHETILVTQGWTRPED